MHKLLSSGVTERGQRRQLLPGAAGNGVQNSLTKNILWLTTTKVSLI